MPDSLAILLPLPLAGSYDYLGEALALGKTLAPGDFVVVPLGRRETIGVVWGPGSGEVPAGKLKPVIARLDVPPLPEVTRRFVDRVAGYTLAPPGAVLRMAMSVSAALEPPRLLAAWRLATDSPAEAPRETPARRRVRAVLRQGPARSTADLAREAGVGTGVIKAMAAAGLLDPVTLPAAAFRRPDGFMAGPVLSPAQAAAAGRLVAQMAEGGVTLLDGVTGSGKTEVYFEAVAEALRAGHQALVLLPEIALTAQWLERFERRFGARPAEWHSDLTGAERRTAWRAIAAGEARVVVGARSALFLPFPALGLIIVDEEHEQAYKQEDGVAYQARDMAVLRGHLARIPVVLVSATPSLETLQNVAGGRYRALHLPDRHAGAALPKVGAIDLRIDRPARQRWLSPGLVGALERTLAEGEQALLFLNRRGYAPLTLCRHCGHRLNCPNCTAWLVEHRHAGRLQCHHCGYQARLPEACPACGATGSFAACGPGVERLAEETAALFPAARLALLTSDTLGGPRAAAAAIDRILRHEVDLLIGTQVVAKGHHFPMLTLVGVVDADLGLSGGDLRAAERTYQLLHQVAGRAGRAERAGQVLLQTYDPGHPVIRALVAGDRDGLIGHEMAERQAAGMPPFGRLAALILSGTDVGLLDRIARELARAAPAGPGILVLGPAPAPLALLRGRHRRRFLMKCRRDIAPQPLLRAWLAKVKLPASVRLQVDVDPYSFL
jgi:primosomal protein N' (replication factor Y) (superfamily II helicase)